MKKQIPLIIAIILLFQSAGYFIFFKIQQLIIQEEVKENIERNLTDAEYMIFKIPVNKSADQIPDLKRINKREFIFRNMMFDIVKKKQFNDTIWYFCLSDEKETTLFANLDDLLKQQQESNPTHHIQQKLQLSLFSIVYDYQNPEFHLLIPDQSIHFKNLLAQIDCFLPETLKPPPKFNSQIL